MTFNQYRWKGYCLKSAYKLTPLDVESCCALFENPDQENKAVLGGRSKVQCCEIGDLGPLVLKRYRRGGFLSHINRQYYLSLSGSNRASGESHFLQLASQTGINAPEPVVVLKQGRMIYRAGLFVREIPDSITLVEMIQTKPEHFPALVGKLNDTIEKLISSNIFHVDFHPGNVLVDTNDTIWVIDFDKARTWKSTSQKLELRYQQRWDRSIKKYQLPDFLLWNRIRF